MEAIMNTEWNIGIFLAVMTPGPFPGMKPGLNVGPINHSV